MGFMSKAGEAPVPVAQRLEIADVGSIGRACILARHGRTELPPLVEKLREHGFEVVPARSAADGAPLIESRLGPG